MSFVTTHKQKNFETANNKQLSSYISWNLVSIESDFDDCFVITIYMHVTF